MKVQIVADECYPFYVIFQNPRSACDWRPIVEVPDELVERHEKLCNELYKLMEEVEQYYKQTKEK